MAVGLLTEQDLTLLGNSFTRLWPVEEKPGFEGLLGAIDQAERDLDQLKEQCR